LPPKADDAHLEGTFSPKYVLHTPWGSGANPTKLFTFQWGFELQTTKYQKQFSYPINK
jgi:hypothetical protein